MQNLLCENEFDLNENEHVGRIHFHRNGFARRLVLTQRQKTTRKWYAAKGAAGFSVVSLKKCRPISQLLIDFAALR